MAKGSLGAAAARSGLIPMTEYRAKNPEPGTSIVAGGGTRKRRGGRRSDGGSGGSGGGRSSREEEKETFTSPDQVPLDDKTVKKVKELKHNNVLMEERKQNILSQEGLPEKEARIEVAKADRTIMSNIWETFQTTKDNDGKSGVAGEMWAEWSGTDGRDMVMQEYESDDGEKRVRVLTRSDKLIKKDGKITNEPEYQVADFRGAKADFSVKELEARLSNMNGEDPKPEYVTREDGTRMMVKGGRASPVTNAAGEGLKVYNKDSSVKTPKEDAAREIYATELEQRLPDTGRKIDPADYQAAEKAALEATIKQMKGFYNVSDAEIKKMVGAFDGDSGPRYKSPEEVRKAFQNQEISEKEAKSILREMLNQ